MTTQAQTVSFKFYPKLIPRPSKSHHATPLPNGPKCWDFNDSSQRGHLSDWKILLRDDMLQFLWDFGCVCASSIDYEGEYFPKSNMMSGYSPKSLFLNVWAARPVGIKIKDGHFKFRNAINKTNWNFTPSKRQKKIFPEYPRTKYLALHILEEKYNLHCNLFL